MDRALSRITSCSATNNTGSGCVVAHPDITRSSNLNFGAVGPANGVLSKFSPFRPDQAGRVTEKRTFKAIGADCGLADYKLCWGWTGFFGPML